MPKPFIERKNNAILDVIELQKDGYTDIHFQGVHLTGGTESNKSHNECYFGKLDSNNTQMGLDESQPIYFLQSNGYISNIDSKVSYNINTNASTTSKHNNTTSNKSNKDCKENNNNII